MISQRIMISCNFNLARMSPVRENYTPWINSIQHWCFLVNQWKFLDRVWSVFRWIYSLLTFLARMVISLCSGDVLQQKSLVYPYPLGAFSLRFYLNTKEWKIHDPENPLLQTVFGCSNRGSRPWSQTMVHRKGLDHGAGLDPEICGSCEFAPRRVLLVNSVAVFVYTRKVKSYPFLVFLVRKMVQGKPSKITKDFLSLPNPLKSLVQKKGKTLKHKFFGQG